jgi:5-methylcytosine-specific restriction endonuclease McrA
MGSLATSNYRRRRKENLIKVCGGKCALCGYDKIPDSLEFHHIDPTTKSFGIASGGTCHDLEADLQEVQKCILVCANCHREIEANLYSVEEIKAKQYFDVDYANLLREEKKNLSKKTIYYCTQCGK